MREAKERNSENENCHADARDFPVLSIYGNHLCPDAPKMF
jgi:hypothetical protein